MDRLLYLSRRKSLCREIYPEGLGREIIVIRRLRYWEIVELGLGNRGLITDMHQSNVWHHLKLPNRVMVIVMSAYSACPSPRHWVAINSFSQSYFIINKHTYYQRIHCEVFRCSPVVCNNDLYHNVYQICWVGESGKWDERCPGQNLVNNTCRRKWSIKFI